MKKLSIIFRSFALAMLLLHSITSKAQVKQVTLSGAVKDSTTNTGLPYVNVMIKSPGISAGVAGTITDDKGAFIIKGLKPGSYQLEVSYLGFQTKKQELFIGALSEFLDRGSILLSPDSKQLKEITVSARPDEVSGKMDKKTFSLGDNTAQRGGSVLQALQNLPGVTTQDGKLQLRGNDKVMILIDGQQTALTGFNGQTGLDNLPASAIDKIEIINNPSSRYDANGNAGIINIIYKKNKEEGFNGKVGLANGYGALWERKANLPTIRPQYSFTPKINPSLALNYRKEKINIYFQGDYLYTQTLNKNEFVTRTYDDGTIINQQTKRNRNTHFTMLKTGVDWNLNPNDQLTFSAMYGGEKIIDNGDQPFFNEDLSSRLRLWQFLEDEVKTTAMASTMYQHKFSQPGRLFYAGINYTFHREDEKYFFDNIMPTFTGHDAFKLISDEHVLDVNADYIQPLRFGRLETGLKFRERQIPTNMQFFPGLNSPIDANAGGPATYKETIPAVYGNYVFENNKIEAEAGVRLEYLNLQYEVGANHPVYKTDGYNYFQPFPSLRFAYKFNDNNKLSVFYNRRVDRPNEVDIRIFPKYDDAEIIKVGNPGLRPQFTNSVELGYRASFARGYFFASAYYKQVDGTITRIATTVPGSTLIYNVFQNAGKSNAVGSELIYSLKPAKWYSFNLNGNVYRNTVEPFTVNILYPQPTAFTGTRQELTSGSVKWNNTFNFSSAFSGQVMMAYLAPDIVPQGRVGARFSTDLGLKRTLQKGKGELFLNATDIFNTLVIQKQVQGNGFSYTSKDYYETQMVRLGYSYKF